MKKVIEFLNGLIAQAHGIRQMWAPNTGPTDAFDMHYSRWMTSAKHVLAHAGLDSFLDKVNKIEDGHLHAAAQVMPVAGILESARDCLQNGFVGKLKYLLHAEMFDSLVGQAKELISTGHRIPAAVLARIVLERWLRDQAEKAGISEWETDRASVLNDKLKAQKVFSQPKWRYVLSLLDVGNSAAHGKEADVTDEAVRRMIEFVEVNCN